MTAINFSNNFIDEIPYSLDQLAHLSVTFLQNNLIKEISLNSLNLEHLIHFYLNNNKLNDFSFSFSKHPFLQTLNLSGNNIKEFPGDMIKSNERLMKGYLTKGYLKTKKQSDTITIL